MPTDQTGPGGAHPARYWHRLDDGRLQCDLCPRHCRLDNGQRGMCFVRARRDDVMVSTTYGRSSGFCVDPIEKKPLNNFLPGTPVFSFGTAGCNLACRFCQNWDISKAKSWDVCAQQASPGQIARQAEKLDCRSVAFTYNDPVIFLEYAVDTAKACRAASIRTVAVTAGYMCAEPRKEFYEWMDAANVDLKAFTEKFYKEQAGGRLEPVLDTLKYIKKETNTWLEITTLLIPGENDSDAEINGMTRWIAKELGKDVPLHLSAFHPAYRVLNKPATPPETLARARNLAMRNGLRYVYTGNVHDEEGGSTYCHNCTRKIIGRDWYEMTEWNLEKGGRCKFCKAPCAGVFDEKPGGWGSRRRPVRM